MALLRKINSKAKTEINTGFGANASDYGGRFVNKTGKPNIEIRGVSFLNRISWYTLKEVVVGAKFLPMYHRSSAGSKTILEIEKLNSFVEADVSFTFATDSKTASV